MIPFFVADRPMSLRIIKGLPLEDYPTARVGIMAHANTSSNFQEALQRYPCENFEFCDAVGGPCQFKDEISKCPARQRILERTVKMCDSGIFTREGATLTYHELFATYERMGVEYGVMIDVFQDTDATITSAEEALPIYQAYQDKFKLVVVAQGEKVEDYLRCYRTLREMGFQYIAVGGLLQKVNGTARYTQVRDESFMDEVLTKIRKQYPKDWLFALGCYHPDRHKKFKELNIWGDYKGWIFQYKKINVTLDAVLDTFANNHLVHDLEEVSYNDDIQEVVHSIQKEVERRTKNINKQKRLVNQLNDGKRTFKDKLKAMYHELLQAEYEFAEQFEGITNHGLLKSSKETVVRDALIFLERNEAETTALWENLSENRTIKQKINKLEQTLNRKNKTIAKLMHQLFDTVDNLPSKIVEDARYILKVIESTEQDHRLDQVRHVVGERILSQAS
jgi:hypothetical protein